MKGCAATGTGTIGGHATTTEFTYSNYADWNNPLNKVEAWYAGKMVEKKNGTVVRDLTTTETETGSLYVVMPVPASVKKAMMPTRQPSIQAMALPAPGPDGRARR